MSSLSFSAVLPVGMALAVGLIAGCAHSSETRQTTPPTPQGSVVTSEDIERTAPTGPIEKVLEGRVAGVTVTRTDGGGIAVRIRGVSSFLGGNEPLYVLDGIPIQPGPGGSLTGINPHDIASIEVLKNPADVAIYGVRGANGVIVIKTKRPGQ
jgi:TonB-dependent SusC/RagA subfamily outer membrane receptor